MRILAFSDTHGRLPNIDRRILPLVDCVMIAGDICPFNYHKEWWQKIWLEGVFCPWVEDLEKPVYLTLGNHDYVDYFEGPPNLRYGTDIIIEDVLLFSWTPIFGDWAWEQEEGFLAQRLEELLATQRRPPSIWLTHGPPWGVCDLVYGEHAGSRALREAVEKYRPRLVICGHIHNAAGFGNLGDTKVFNVSALDADNVWKGQPTLIQI